MSLNHGINTYKSDTKFASVTKAQVGIPLFVGAMPIHKSGTSFDEKPILINNFEEFRALGYSGAWRDVSGNPKWNLCQAAYGFLLLSGMAPAFFVNVYNPATHKTEVAEAEYDVTDHTVQLPDDAIVDDSFVVKVGTNTIVKGTDYSVIYTDNACKVELLSTGGNYTATKLKITYNKADLSQITASVIETAFEKAELCKTVYNVVPDLLCCPGWSKNPAVAAVMAAKAQSINGLFRAKAVVDLDTAAAAADSYDDVLTWKSNNGYTDEYMIVCWPLAKIDDMVFDLSVLICGVICRTDTNNGDLPYESPSNKTISITGLCNAAGDDIYLTVQQADIISYSAGVVTILNFGGYVVWGNYTGCWPVNSDVADCFIPTSRMMDFLSNTFVITFWGYVDKPLSRVLIDAIVNSFNSYLDGLTATGALLGGEIAYVEDNNPTADLLGGKFRLDLQMASAVPAQQINLFSEFSVSMLTESLSV